MPACAPNAKYNSCISGANRFVLRESEDNKLWLTQNRYDALDSSMWTCPCHLKTWRRHRNPHLVGMTPLLPLPEKFCFVCTPSSLAYAPTESHCGEECWERTRTSQISCACASGGLFGVSHRHSWRACAHQTCDLEFSLSLFTFIMRILLPSCFLFTLAWFVHFHLYF